MSMEIYDVEWRCGCGVTNPDYDYLCRMCGVPRYLEDEDEDGTSGQDRESYSDTQDRDSYTVDPELE
jgi:hypothetical protein